MQLSACPTHLTGECGHIKVTRANKMKKRPWYSDTVHQKAFGDLKTSIAKDVVLVYPDYARKFEIYIDALSKQLGLVITQGNRPLAFSAETVNSATEIQRDQIRTTGHNGNTKRVQRHVVETKIKNLYRPSCLPMEAHHQGIWPQNCLH
eukprot:CCRYP_015257-RA/>CCRYP_015257-RA protein AED:0.46 eAED:0.70 QI:0/0/0/1/0/0/2/0/148